MRDVTAICERPCNQVQTEIALVANLCATLAVAPEAGAPGVWCARQLCRVTENAPCRTETDKQYKLSVLTPTGVYFSEGTHARGAFYWQTPCAGLVLRVPCGVADDAIVSTLSPVSTRNMSLSANVHALRAAASRRISVSDVPYVRDHAILHGMSVCEVAISMLCNGDSDLRQ